MMKKNYFNFKKAMTAAMMLLSVSMTMTSCADFWEDVFGPDDTPTETPAEPEDDAKVTLTATGATIKVEKVSDITELLNQIKADIASKAGQEYVVEIISEGLKATSDDNTVSVPKVEKSNINLTFANGITTEVPLVVKATETESTLPTDAINQLTITMPTSEGLKLTVDMPETVITLKATSKTLIYDEVIVTNASRNPYVEANDLLEHVCLSVEDGIIIKNLQASTYNGSCIIVKDESKIETYVYAPTTNSGDTIYIDEAFISNSADANSNRINYLKIHNASNYSYIFKEKDGITTYYNINNLKIAKGEADYANVCFLNWSEIDKLTIAEGAIVKLSVNNALSQCYPIIGSIEGEGNGAELIMMSKAVVLSQDFALNKSVATLSCGLYYVTEMKGISLSVEPENQEVKEMLATADIPRTYIGDISSCDLENCTFKCDMFDLRYTSSHSIKGCKFDATIGIIMIPEQTDEISSYKLSFTNCDFNKDLKFSIGMNLFIFEFDENGNRVFYETPYYTYYDHYYEIWRCVQSKDDIPEGTPEMEWAEMNVQQQRFTTIKYSDGYATIAINNCKLGDSTFAAPSDFSFTDGQTRGSLPTGTYLRYEIEGTTYKASWNEEAEKYNLIPLL